MPALTIHRPGQPPERRELDAPVAAGGSRADDLVLAGCPPSALRLVPCAAGVVAEAIASGVRVGGRPVHPGARRLLRCGERVELLGVAISLEPATDGDRTRIAAGALLRDAAAGEAPIAGAHLVVLSGPAAGTRHPLRSEQTIGRGRAAGVTIPDARASRVHARIRLGTGGATVEDLGSKNGVRVNGVRIDRRPHPVGAGDELEVGETAVALQGLESAPGAAAPELRGGRARRLRAARHLVAAVLLALSAAALVLAAG